MSRRLGRDPLRVEVLRGGQLESVHEVDVVVADAAGHVVLRSGRFEEPVFVRSAVKPFQALPLVVDGVADEIGLTDEEIAICCASHSGEEAHVAAAQSILHRIGRSEDDLACGPHPPFSSAAAAALRAEGREPGRIHNNCSGKHAGMLALARGHGWDPVEYHTADHPVQRRVLEEVARWTDVEPGAVRTGVDGCGVVTFALPLPSLALAFARLITEGADRGSPAGRVLSAMRAHPFLVAGSNRLCTAVMEATRGRVLAKVGAEGVYGAAVMDRGWGIALKVRDGARRAAETALVETLAASGAITDDEIEALNRWHRPELRNTRGEAVGGIRARMAVSGGVAE